MKNFLRHSALLALFALCFVSLKAEVGMPEIFSDHMVLQRDKPINVWGWAAPGEKINVNFNGKDYPVTAATDGMWKVTLPSLRVGGPYTMTVKGDGNTLTFTDVLMGDVWLCSGQSNMEWRVNAAMNKEEEIKNANYPQIRMITYDRDGAGKLLPQKDHKSEGNWIVCSPATVEKFSSAAYFFGRDIYQSLGGKVPIGLINSSMGGTRIEPWMEPASVGKVDYYKKAVANLDELRSARGDVKKENEIFDRQNKEWEKEVMAMDPGFKDGKPLFASPDFNSAGWDKVNNPVMIQKSGFTLKNGVFWYRKEIDVPQSWAGKPLTLRFGRLDDNDVTYFNGTEVGTGYTFFANRNYTVPGNLVKAGKNLIAVRLFDTGGEGGFMANPEDFYVESSNGEKLSLVGPWEINFAIEAKDMPPSPERGGVGTPSALYNDFIYPNLGYAIKGAIWYQGEANTDNAHTYRKLLPFLIEGWRDAYGYDFPFYIVQLANHYALQTEPTESAWAELREAQLMGWENTKNTGMAVIIDAGEANNIHPANKQAVGSRLALQARRNTYGEKNLVYSGPVYESYTVKGDKIIIKFKTFGSKGMKAKDGGKLTGFTIAGEDKKFYWADAVIEGKDKIVVSAKEVKNPVAVRYAWADNPVFNLYNIEDIPASPFRTDDWPGITR